MFVTRARARCKRPPEYWDFVFLVIQVVLLEKPPWVGVWGLNRNVVKKGCHRWVRSVSLKIYVEFFLMLSKQAQWKSYLWKSSWMCVVQYLVSRRGCITYICDIRNLRFGFSIYLFPSIQPWKGSLHVLSMTLGLIVTTGISPRLQLMTISPMAFVNT
jgi:hypothetical protein